MTDKTDAVTHTPLPWCVDAHDNIFDKDDNRIAQVWGGDIVQDNARSALIVRAVNSHADLIALAHQYASDLRHPPSADSVERRLERIAAVLAKVGA
jgi:hypothetical protein